VQGLDLAASRELVYQQAAERHALPSVKTSIFREVFTLIALGCMGVRARLEVTNGVSEGEYHNNLVHLQ
jgi:hypothetical protein